MSLPKTPILDDPAKIGEIDSSNMLSSCIDAPKHYEKAAEHARKLSIDLPEPRTIVIAGMGGSAIGGELFKDWARDKLNIPIEICREYSLPAYADRKTLVFVVSYSGETEESLSVFLDSLRRKCMTICICSGGKLAEFAEKLSMPVMFVPSGMAPRAALPYLFTPLPLILQRIGLVKRVDDEISEMIRTLRLISNENSPRKPLKSNLSKTLASAVKGTTPAIYGFGFFRAAAQRLKTQFNENSKAPAKWEYFSELDHNEIVGWETPKGLEKCFSVILIRDEDEPAEMRRRIEVTKGLVKKTGLKVFEVWSRGESTMAKMFSVISIGDFTSVYLAVLRAVNPTPVKTIDILKERLAKTGFRDATIRELQKFAEKRKS